MATCEAGGCRSPAVVGNCRSLESSSCLITWGECRAPGRDDAVATIRHQRGGRPGDVFFCYPLQ
jgi:hypothetical protein